MYESQFVRKPSEARTTLVGVKIEVRSEMTKQGRNNEG